MKKVIASICYITGFSAILLLSAIDSSLNIWEVGVPYMLVAIISLLLATYLMYETEIRRVTYPALVCTCAWLHKTNLLKTKFTSNAYKVFKMQHRSYEDLYFYVQDLFDLYVKGLKA